MTDPLAALLKPNAKELHREFVEAVAEALDARGLTADALGSIEKLRFSNGRYEATYWALAKNVTQWNAPKARR